jgi:hypothetical protein
VVTAGRGHRLQDLAQDLGGQGGDGEVATRGAVAVVVQREAGGGAGGGFLVA